MEGYDLLERELAAIGKLERLYERVAEFVEPSHLEENPLPAVRAYLSALRSLERCIELRAKLVIGVGRLPRPEPEQPMATVDLGRLSDEALREVEAAMVPIGPDPERISKTKGERNDRIGLCEKNIENKITSAVPESEAKALPPRHTVRSSKARGATAKPERPAEADRIPEVSLLPGTENDPPAAATEMSPGGNGPPGRTKTGRRPRGPSSV